MTFTSGYPHDLRQKETQIGELYHACELFEYIQDVIGDTETWMLEMVDLFMTRSLGNKRRLQIAVFSYHNGVPVEM